MPRPFTLCARHGLSALALCALQALSPLATAQTAPAAADTARIAPPMSLPWVDQTVSLANGVAGRPLRFASANPRHYEDILAARDLPAITLGAQLFVPAGPAGSRWPAVIITPGSGGVNPSMLIHAQKLTDAGMAVLLVDPFTARGVKNTIADQEQFSFAASTYDVLAALKALEAQSDIDASRVGAMGYSRGGIAVLQAAITPLADRVLGPRLRLKAVLAAWPWCGYQFAPAQTAPTAVHFALGDSDNWVSPLQCQAYFNAMKPLNPQVSHKLYKGGNHGLGYGVPLQELPQAVKALNAPIVYFDAQGQMLDPWTQLPRPGMDDSAIARMAAAFVTRGARAGTEGTLMAEFMADMSGYFSTQLRR